MKSDKTKDVMLNRALIVAKMSAISRKFFGAVTRVGAEDRHDERIRHQHHADADAQGVEEPDRRRVIDEGQTVQCDQRGAQDAEIAANPRARVRAVLLRHASLSAFRGIGARAGDGTASRGPGCGSTRRRGERIVRRGRRRSPGKAAEPRTRSGACSRPEPSPL